VEEIKEFYFKVMGLVILTGLMSCNPQKSDLSSSCGSSEEYSEVVNDCVAVVSSQKADLSISYYYPTNFSTYYKNSTDQISYSIGVENPDDLDFDIKWERIYLGVTYPLSSTELTQNLRPSDYSNSIGDHQIIVKLIYQNNVVASHIFSVSISDLPTPIIDESLTTPKEVKISTTVKGDPINFSLTVLNNSSPIEDTEHETRWKVYRNNIIIHQETDPFINESPTDSNTFLLGSNYLDPEILGVGNYKITAEVVKSSMNQVLQKKEWMVSVKPPSLAPVISRNILRTDTSRNFETKIRTYHDIFFDDHLTPLGDFCVEVEEGEGSYTGDNQFVRVDFYLDSSPSPTYSGFTTLATKKVCLSDGDYSAIKFQNTNPTQIESHSIKARVFDQRQNKEYTQTNMRSGTGTYPIVWNFETHPQNRPPIVSFPDDLATNCLIISPTFRTCFITENLPFKLGLRIQDEFFDPTSDLNQFEYGMTFSRLSPSPLAISSCSKTTSDTGLTDYPSSDYIGPNYFCDFSIPSYTANGPLDPRATIYSLQTTGNDNGSPYTSTKLFGDTLSSSFVITEVNTSPILLGQDPFGLDDSQSFIFKSGDPSVPILNADEGDEISFSLKVQDSERDHFYYSIHKCLNELCLIKTEVIQENTLFTKTDGDLLSLPVVVNFEIPYNFVNINEVSEDIYFIAEVKDAPHTLLPQSASPRIFKLTVTNINPAPEFTTNPNPIPETFAISYPKVMIGMPYSIDPGAVIDDSIDELEDKIGYQWYVDKDGLDSNYERIPGATERKITWTPPSVAYTDQIFNLKLCIHDFTSLNPLPDEEEDGDLVESTGEGNNQGANCRGPWNLKSIFNSTLLNNAFLSEAPIQTEIAIWVDQNESTVSGFEDKRIIYTAFADNNGYIYVDKIILNNDGSFNNSPTTGFQTVKFSALEDPDDLFEGIPVKDLSLSGTDKYLLIAYSVDQYNNGNRYIKIRRINKSYGNMGDGDVGRKVNYPHPGKFGFVYDESDLEISSFPTVSATIDYNLSRFFYNEIFGVNVNICDPNLYCIGIGINTIATLADEENLLDDDYLSINGVIFATNNPANPVDCNFPFCADNTLSENRANLKDAINESTDRRLQGLTAWNSVNSFFGYTVTNIDGSFGFDFNGFSNPPYKHFIDIPGTITKQLGRIMVEKIDGVDYFILPRLMSGSGIGIIIREIDRNFGDNNDGYYSRNGVFQSLSKNVKSFSNKVYLDASTNTYKIAIVTVADEISNGKTLPNVATLNTYNFSKSFNLSRLKRTFLFNKQNVAPDSISFSTPQKMSYTLFPVDYLARNSNFFILGKIQDSQHDSHWEISRLNSSQTDLEEFNIFDIATTKTKSILQDSTLNSISIETYLPQPQVSIYSPFGSTGAFSSEARLLISSSKSEASSNYSNLYTAKFSSGDKDVIDCGECQKVNHTNHKIHPTQKITPTPVFPFRNLPLGDSGDNGSENYFTGLFLPVISNNGSAFTRPRLLLLNMRPEEMSGTSTPPTIPLGYRPSFIPK
jgi:hypothetical protein